MITFNQFLEENKGIAFSVAVDDSTMFCMTGNQLMWFFKKAEYNLSKSEIYKIKLTEYDVFNYVQKHSEEYEKNGRFCKKAIMFMKKDVNTNDIFDDREFYQWILNNAYEVNFVDLVLNNDLPPFDRFKELLKIKISSAYAQMSPKSNGLVMRDKNGDVYDIPRNDAEFLKVYDETIRHFREGEFFLDFYEDYTDACNGCGDSVFIDVALTFKDLKGEKDEPKKLTKGYRWTAKSDDGSYEDESEVFATEKECYLNMRDAVLEKMKWNTEYEDVNECVDVYDYIDYHVKFNEKWAVHKSYSGTYLYKVEKVG